MNTSSCDSPSITSASSVQLYGEVWSERRLEERWLKVNATFPEYVCHLRLQKLIQEEETATTSASSAPLLNPFLILLFVLLTSLFLKASNDQFSHPWFSYTCTSQCVKYFIEVFFSYVCIFYTKYILLPCSEQNTPQLTFLRNIFVSCHRSCFHIFPIRALDLPMPCKFLKVLTSNTLFKYISHITLSSETPRREAVRNTKLCCNSFARIPQNLYITSICAFKIFLQWSSDHLDWQFLSTSQVMYNTLGYFNFVSSGLSFSLPFLSHPTHLLKYCLFVPSYSRFDRIVSTSASQNALYIP